MKTSIIKIVKHDQLNPEVQSAVKEILKAEKNIKEGNILGGMAHFITNGTVLNTGVGIAMAADHPAAITAGLIVPLIVGARVSLMTGKQTEAYIRHIKTKASGALKLLRDTVKNENGNAEVKATHFFVHPKTGDLHLIHADEMTTENFKPLGRNKRFAVK